MTILHLKDETELLDLITEKATKERTKHPEKPFIVGICGIPGSGKSYLCQSLGTKISEVLCLPLDGYHIELSKLRKELVYFRGAKDTFDIKKALQDLSLLLGDQEEVWFPGFNHSIGDPEEKQYRFERKKHQAVIVEGIWTFVEQTRNIFNMKVWVSGDIDICMDILKERNKSIPGYTEEEIVKRVEEVDRKTAEEVQEYQINCDVIFEGIHSKIK
eukprot:snap_masked-scaffold_9-processed-gene-3.12-mRNA-1 protein AED:1.00 eAED:1.00 QI:0/-1/0/0/-1/1/1/0/215